MKSRITLLVVFEGLENTTSNFTLCFLNDSRSGWFHEWASQGRTWVHAVCIINGNWLVCLKVGITGGDLFGSQKRPGISWKTERLLASLETRPPSPSWSWLWKLCLQYISHVPHVDKESTFLVQFRRYCVGHFLAEFTHILSCVTWFSLGRW